MNNMETERLRQQWRSKRATVGSQDRNGRRLLGLMVAAILLAATLVGGAVPFAQPAAADDLFGGEGFVGAVADECVDPDGDGWGWAGSWPNGVSCRMACVDPDGDGWGWRGVWPAGGSCEMVTSPSHTEQVDTTSTVSDVTAQTAPVARSASNGERTGHFVNPSKLSPNQLDENADLLRVSLFSGAHSSCAANGPDGDDCIAWILLSEPGVTTKEDGVPDSVAEAITVGTSAIGGFIGETVGGKKGGAIGTVIGHYTGKGIVAALNAYGKTWGWVYSEQEAARQGAWAASQGATNGLGTNTTDADCGGCDTADTSFDSTDSDCGGCDAPDAQGYADQGDAIGPGDSDGGGGWGSEDGNEFG